MVPQERFGDEGIEENDKESGNVVPGDEYVLSHAVKSPRAIDAECENKIQAGVRVVGVVKPMHENEKDVEDECDGI